MADGIVASHKRTDEEWRGFERLVARIERDVDAKDLVVTSPDWIKSRVTGRPREVDASIRARVGSSEVLITLECRRRKRVQDVTWIEQLASKKAAIGADRTIAVSASGFTTDAEKIAELNGISLRKLSDVSVADINSLLRLDFVLFWHKACSVVRVGIRKFTTLDWQVPDPNKVDFTLPDDIDVLVPIFHNEETGANWSLNDLWHQLQEATDPFVDVEKGQKPVLRTACFPYPGTVTLSAGKERCLLGDVILTVALWIEAEKISLESARKVEYTATDKPALQRVEFTSRRYRGEDWRVSLQIPKDSEDIADLHTGGDWPENKGRP